MDFEKSITRINEIIDELNKNNTNLSKSMELFEEGTRLINNCTKILDDAEQKVMILQGDKEVEFNGN